MLSSTARREAFGLFILFLSISIIITHSHHVDLIEHQCKLWFIKIIVLTLRLSVCHKTFIPCFLCSTTIKNNKHVVIISLPNFTARSSIEKTDSGCDVIFMDYKCYRT